MMLKRSGALLSILLIGSGFSAAQETSSVSQTTDDVTKPKLVQLFNGRKIESAQAIPITVVAAGCSKILPADSKGAKLKLPAKFKVDEKQTTTRFRLLSSDGKQTIFGAIRHLPGDALVQLLEDQRPIKVVLDEGDLKDSMAKSVTKFISIPKQEPGKKWDGNFAILTMENVTIGQFKGVTKNTKDYAGMLAVVQIAAEGVVPGNQLPTFSKNRSSETEPNPPGDEPR